MNTADIINMVEKFQSCGWVHPMTCGNNSAHKLLIPIEKDGKVILACEDCEYEQSWIPEVVLDGSWQELGKDIL